MSETKEQQIDLFLNNLPQESLPTGFASAVLDRLPAPVLSRASIQFRLKLIDFVLPIVVTALCIIFIFTMQQDLTALFTWQQSFPIPTFANSTVAAQWVPLAVILTLVQVALFTTLVWGWLDDPLESWDLPGLFD